jgi:hypothetical protein
MTITVPEGLWDKYYEAVDFFIDDDHIGRACTIVYPPLKEACVNCITPVGMSNTNVYRDGGPAPFSFGNCPLCGGSGYKETESTDTARLRIYWNRADWIRIAGSIVAPDAEVMVIGYMADLPKIKRATSLLLAKDNNEASYRAVLAGQPNPWGFGRNRYFVAYLKGA